MSVCWAEKTHNWIFGALNIIRLSRWDIIHCYWVYHFQKYLKSYRLSVSSPHKMFGPVKGNTQAIQVTCFWVNFPNNSRNVENQLYCHLWSLVAGSPKDKKLRLNLKRLPDTFVCSSFISCLSLSELEYKKYKIHFVLLLQQMFCVILLILLSLILVDFSNFVLIRINWLKEQL